MDSPITIHEQLQVQMKKYETYDPEYQSNAFDAVIVYFLCWAPTEPEYISTINWTDHQKKEYAQKIIDSCNTGPNSDEKFLQNLLEHMKTFQNKPMIESHGFYTKPHTLQIHLDYDKIFIEKTEL